MHNKNIFNCITWCTVTLKQYVGGANRLARMEDADEAASPLLYLWLDCHSSNLPYLVSTMCVTIEVVTHATKAKLELSHAQVLYRP